MDERRLAIQWGEELGDIGERKCPLQAAGYVACSTEAQLPTLLPGGELRDREMSEHGSYAAAIAARGVVVPRSLCCAAPVAAIGPGLHY